MKVDDFSIEPTHQELVIKANTVEEAIERGLIRLGLTQEDASIEILSDSESGPLDSDTQQAEVKIQGEAVDLLETVQSVLSGILTYMGLDQFDVSNQIVGKFIRTNIESDRELRFVIGKQGETLNSIQHLLEEILRLHSDRPVNVIVDAGNYRERRRNDLERLAHEKSDEVLQEDCEIELDPMIPVERKVIHQTIKEIEGVKSHSIGEDANRRVVILPKGRS